MSGTDGDAERDDASSVDELLADLGPFEPPEGYEFEPELRDARRDE